MIGGGFRLGFGGYTTSTISHDATASELGVALTDLPSIDSVDVSTDTQYQRARAKLWYTMSDCCDSQVEYNLWGHGDLLREL